MAAFFELKVNQKYLGEMSRLVPSVAERKGRWWGGGGGGGGAPERLECEDLCAFSYF